MDEDFRDYCKEGYERFIKNAPKELQERISEDVTTYVSPVAFFFKNLKSELNERDAFDVISSFICAIILSSTNNIDEAVVLVEDVKKHLKCLDSEFNKRF